MLLDIVGSKARFAVLASLAKGSKLLLGVLLEFMVLTLPRPIGSLGGLRAPV